MAGAVACCFPEFLQCFLGPSSPPLGGLSQEPSGPRSPAVFGSIVSYVEQFFETVGISLADRQVRPALLGPRLWQGPGVLTTTLSPFTMFVQRTVVLNVLTCLRKCSRESKLGQSWCLTSGRRRGSEQNAAPLGRTPRAVCLAHLFPCLSWKTERGQVHSRATRPRPSPPLSPTARASAPCPAQRWPASRTRTPPRAPRLPCALAALLHRETTRRNPVKWVVNVERPGLRPGLTTRGLGPLRLPGRGAGARPLSGTLARLPHLHGGHWIPLGAHVFVTRKTVFYRGGRN